MADARIILAVLIVNAFSIGVSLATIAFNVARLP